MKIVTIMQAVSSSGKSLIAQAIANSTGAVICSADNYFMVDGEYRFDVARLHAAHNYCQELFENTLKMGKNAIVDNTNINSRDYRFYVEKAKEYGYVVQWVRVELPLEACIELNSLRGSKAIPSSVIQRQHENLMKMKNNKA